MDRERNVTEELAIARFLGEVAGYMDQKQDGGVVRLKTAGWLYRRMGMDAAAVEHLWRYAVAVATSSPGGMFARWLERPSVLTKKLGEMTRWMASKANRAAADAPHPRDAIAPVHSLNEWRKKA